MTHNNFFNYLFILSTYLHFYTFIFFSIVYSSYPLIHLSVHSLIHTFMPLINLLFGKEFIDSNSYSFYSLMYLSVITFIYPCIYSVLPIALFMYLFLLPTYSFVFNFLTYSFFYFFHSFMCSSSELCFGSV